MPAAYGPVRHAGHVEQAVLATLRAWERTYLADIEREDGLPPRSLPVARSWVVAAQFDWRPEDQLPCVVVLSTGIPSRPDRHGDGVYTATFDVGVAVIAAVPGADDGMERAALLVRRMLAAYRQSLLGQQDLGGLATGVQWTDEDLGLLTHRRRTLAGAEAGFLVTVDDVAADFQGPDEVPEDPYDPPGPPVIADQVSHTVHKEPL